jgi:hypothetical protein
MRRSVFNAGYLGHRIGIQCVCGETEEAFVRQCDDPIRMDGRRGDIEPVIPMGC